MSRIVHSPAEVARRWATGACRIWLAGLVAGVLWALGAVPASADGIPVGIGSGSGEPLPATFFEDEGNINIGTPSSPVEIYLDPNGMPVWPKTFVIDRRSRGIATGETFGVNEWIRLVPPPDPTIPFLPLTDWHEKILGPPEFEWGPDAEIAFGDPPTVFCPGITSPDNKEVGFEFPPAYPPADIMISKTLVYTGPTFTASPGLIFEVAIEESATTPEPGTWVLLFSAAGVGWLLLRRRR